MFDRESYSQGFADGIAYAREQMGLPSTTIASVTVPPAQRRKKVGGGNRNSPKQRLLTEMTAKKWNQYKKGKGKKTYVQIRAQVSRSQEYKRKAKKL